MRLQTRRGLMLGIPGYGSDVLPDDPENSRPTAANGSVSINEDASHVFIAADFNYSDADSDPMASVKITSLETAGSLQLNGVDVILNQVISKANIDSGLLIFTPVTSENGTPYATFGFSVNDGTEDSVASYTMTINVAASPANQPPVNDLNGPGAGVAAAGTYYAGENFKSFLPDATVTDPDGDALAWLRLTCGGQWGADGPDELLRFDTWTVDSDTDYTADLTVAGTALTLSFTAATGILMVTRSGGGTFTPAVAQALERLLQYANGAEPPTNGERTFTWLANDGATTAAPVTLTVTVTPPPSENPAITTNTGLAIEQGEAPAIINNAMLETTDADTAATSLVYTVTTPPQYGALYRNGISLTTLDTFTQQDVDNNQITYEHDDEYNAIAADAIVVSVSDGSASDIATFIVTIAERPLPWQPLFSANFPYNTDWDRAADIDVDADHAGDLQAAINAAVALATATGSDIIVELTAGNTYSRPTADFKTYRLPTRPPNETNWIIVRSSAFGPSPAVPPDQRIVPTDVPYMANLPMTTADGLPTMATDGPAHHYWLIGLDFEVGARPQAYGPLQIGQGYPVSHVTDQDWKISVSNVATIDELPSYLCVDRCYIHSADDTLANGKLRQGIRAEARFISIRNCDISNVKDTQDAQAIWACYGTGPYHIDNNFLEATGENIMFGGDTTPWEGSRPSDITVTRNHMQKNIAWKDPNLWGVKNIFELKNAKRVLVEGNIIDTCWADGQNGDAFVLTARNQTYERGAATTGENPWAEVSDITIRHNLIHDVGLGINSHVGDNLGAGAGSRTSKRWDIRDNVFYNVRSDFYSAARLFRLTTYGTANARTGDRITIEHNTALFKSDSEGNSAVNRENESGPDVADNVTIKNNILGAGQYWLSGPGTLNGVGVNPPLYSNVRMVRPVESNYATRVAAGDQPTFYNADDFGEVDFNDYADGDFLAGDWTLAPTSRFKAGQSAQADDGQDMGANIAGVNAAIVGVLKDRTGSPTLTPIAHWTLDDNAANDIVLDQIGSLNLTLLGGDTTAAKQTTGQKDGAFLFNGIDDYLYAAAHRGYSPSGYTIAMWVKRAAAAGLAWFCSSNTAIYGAYMTIGSGSSQSNRARVIIKNTAGTTLLIQETAAIVLDNTWHHIAFTDDGLGNATMYVDGVSESFPYTPSGTISYNQLAVGALRRQSDVALYWNGSLDDIRVYDRQLTPEEIATLIA